MGDGTDKRCARFDSLVYFCSDRGSFTPKPEHLLSQFDQETAVIALADDSWQGHISDQWNIGNNPNGGYLLSVALRALREAVPHPDPLTVTTHYLRPGQANKACEVQTELIRTGRSLSTARATLLQEGKPCLVVLAAFSDLTKNVGVDASLTIQAPSMPKPEDCTQRSGTDQGIDLPILSRLDTRLHPTQAIAGASEEAVLTGWIRFTDGTPPSAAALLLFADAFPPSPFAKLGVIGWVPTIELTVQVRRHPAPGWILGRFVTEDLHNGRMVENGSLWDSNGDLVAQSRQLGMVMGGD